MAAIMKDWCHIENPTQSMPTYLKNISDKFHPDLIWDNGAVCFCRSNKNKKKREKKNNNNHNNEMSGKMWSVPDPKN